MSTEAALLHAHIETQIALSDLEPEVAEQLAEQIRQSYHYQLYLAGVIDEPLVEWLEDREGEG